MRMKDEPRRMAGEHARKSGEICSCCISLPVEITKHLTSNDSTGHFLSFIVNIHTHIYMIISIVTLLPLCSSDLLFFFLKDNYLKGL